MGGWRGDGNAADPPGRRAADRLLVGRGAGGARPEVVGGPGPAGAGRTPGGSTGAQLRALPRRRRPARVPPLVPGRAPPSARRRHPLHRRPHRRAPPAVDQRRRARHRPRRPRRRCSTASSSRASTPPVGPSWPRGCWSPVARWRPASTPCSVTRSSPRCRTVARTRALSLAERAARRSPYDEGVHVLLARCLVQAGDHGGAARHVEEVERRFRADLGCDPSPALHSAARPAGRRPSPWRDARRDCIVAARCGTGRGGQRRRRRRHRLPAPCRRPGRERRRPPPRGELPVRARQRARAQRPRVRRRGEHPPRPCRRPRRRDR